MMERYKLVPAPTASSPFPSTSCPPRVKFLISGDEDKVCYKLAPETECDDDDHRVYRLNRSDSDTICYRLSSSTRPRLLEAESVFYRLGANDKNKLRSLANAETRSEDRSRKSSDISPATYPRRSARVVRPKPPILPSTPLKKRKSILKEASASKSGGAGSHKGSRKTSAKPARARTKSKSFDDDSVPFDRVDGVTSEIVDPNSFRHISDDGRGSAEAALQRDSVVSTKYGENSNEVSAEVDFRCSEEAKERGDVVSSPADTVTKSKKSRRDKGDRKKRHEKDRDLASRPRVVFMTEKQGYSSRVSNSLCSSDPTWSDTDEDVFLDALIEFGRDFGRIHQFFRLCTDEPKSVPEIEDYYREMTTKLRERFGGFAGTSDLRNRPSSGGASTGPGKRVNAGNRWDGRVCVDLLDENQRDLYLLFCYHELRRKCPRSLWKRLFSSSYISKRFEELLRKGKTAIEIEVDDRESDGRQTSVTKSATHAKCYVLAAPSSVHLLPRRIRVILRPASSSDADFVVGHARQNPYLSISVNPLRSVEEIRNLLWKKWKLDGVAERVGLKLEPPSFSEPSHLGDDFETENLADASLGQLLLTTNGGNMEALQLSLQYYLIFQDASGEIDVDHSPGASPWHSLMRAASVECLKSQLKKPKRKLGCSDKRQKMYGFRNVDAASSVPNCDGASSRVMQRYPAPEGLAKEFEKVTNLLRMSVNERRMRRTVESGTRREGVDVVVFNDGKREKVATHIPERSTTTTPGRKCAKALFQNDVRGEQPAAGRSNGPPSMDADDSSADEPSTTSADDDAPLTSPLMESLSSTENERTPTDHFSFEFPTPRKDATETPISGSSVFGSSSVISMDFDEALEAASEINAADAADFLQEFDDSDFVAAALGTIGVASSVDIEWPPPLRGAVELQAAVDQESVHVDIVPNASMGDAMKAAVKFHEAKLPLFEKTREEVTFDLLRVAEDNGHVHPIPHDVPNDNLDTPRKYRMSLT